VIAVVRPIAGSPAVEIPSDTLFISTSSVGNEPKAPSWWKGLLEERYFLLSRRKNPLPLFVEHIDRRNRKGSCAKVEFHNLITVKHGMRRVKNLYPQR
jgi:hypothetical protein